jgi:hypothetical protein
MKFQVFVATVAVGLISLFSSVAGYAQDKGAAASDRRDMLAPYPGWEQLFGTDAVNADQRLIGG